MDFDRLKHSLAVANKMMEIGKKLNLSELELEELFVLGYVHDIGYSFSNEKEEHNIIGGNILKNSGYKYFKEVYYHGNPDCNYESLYLEILNQADMQINKYGIDVGYEKRLEDIKQRYGEDSVPYKNSKKLIKQMHF